MRRLCGIETEYGIQVDEVAKMDVVVESMELIRCYLQQDFIAIWNYSHEGIRDRNPSVYFKAQMKRFQDRGRFLDHMCHSFENHAQREREIAQAENEQIRCWIEFAYEILHARGALCLHRLPAWKSG